MSNYKRQYKTVIIYISKIQGQTNVIFKISHIESFTILHFRDEDNVYNKYAKTKTIYLIIGIIESYNRKGYNIFSLSIINNFYIHQKLHIFHKTHVWEEIFPKKKPHRFRNYDIT